MYQDMAASYSPEARGVTQRTVPRPTNGPPKTIPQKRPHPEDPAAQPQGARHLQPKPSAYSLNGADDAPAQGGFDPSASTDSPKRKRGRPTKAEAERRRQEAEARGEQYPPAPKIPKTPTMTAASGLLSNLPGSGGSPGSVLGSGGTPGKRRRGRPTKAEAAAKKALLDIAYDAENPSKATQQTEGYEGAEGEEGEEGEDVEQMLRDEMEMEHSGHTIGGGPPR